MECEVLQGREVSQQRRKAQRQVLIWWPAAIVRVMTNRGNLHFQMFQSGVDSETSAKCMELIPTVVVINFNFKSVVFPRRASAELVRSAALVRAITLSARTSV